MRPARATAQTPQRTTKRRTQVQSAVLIELYRDRLLGVLSAEGCTVRAAELAWVLDDLVASYRARWAS